MSIFVLGIAVTLAGAGTWASLNDAGKSTTNTFTSGTLDMKLHDNDESGDNVVATWVSPANFKPGDTFTAELLFSNDGSIGVNHLYLNPHLDTEKSLSPKGGDLADKIYITNIQGHFFPKGRSAFKTNNLVNWPDIPGYQLDDGNLVLGLKWTDGIWTQNYGQVLTLKQFCGTKYVAYYHRLLDPGHITAPILSTTGTNDFGFIISGKFAPDADNTYQGSSCSFTLNAEATQNSPTQGYVLITDDETISDDS